MQLQLGKNVSSPYPDAREKGAAERYEELVQEARARAPALKAAKRLSRRRRRT